MEYQKSSPTHQPHPLPAANSRDGFHKFSADYKLSSKVRRLTISGTPYEEAALDLAAQRSHLVNDPQTLLLNALT